MRILRGFLRVFWRFRWVFASMMLVAIVLTYVPLFPYQPTCREQGEFYKVSGQLDYHFRAQATSHLVLWDIPFLSVGDKVLLRFYDWLDFESWLPNVTYRSARILLERREEATNGSQSDRRSGLDPRTGRERLTCEQIRSVAIVPPGTYEP